MASRRREQRITDSSKLEISRHLTSSNLLSLAVKSKDELPQIQSPEHRKVLCFVRESVLGIRLFVLKNVVISNHSLEKVYQSFVYSLKKVYFCVQTNMQYDAEKKN